MTRMTLSEANELLTKLDHLIFKADTGQIGVTWNEYTSWKKQAQMLMQDLAHAVAAGGTCTYEEAYEVRKNVRESDRFTATLERHCELNPRTAVRPDSLLAAAFRGGVDGKGDPEALRKLMQSYDYLFANGPRPPKDSSRKPSLLKTIVTRKKNRSISYTADQIRTGTAPFTEDTLNAAIAAYFVCQEVIATSNFHESSGVGHKNDVQKATDDARAIFSWISAAEQFYGAERFEPFRAKMQLLVENHREFVQGLRAMQR
jgi:hypothetical protein